MIHSMRLSNITGENSCSGPTRRAVLCGAGAAATGLFAGCTALPIFGSGVKVVEWNQEDDFAGETTFAIVLKNQGPKTSVTVTIKLHPKPMGGGRTLVKKSKTVTLASGEKRTVRITMMVPDAAESWVVHTRGA